ncbi:MAG: right-handed parallel beta-helix repeat-containing protein [Planctomycetota bacterium]|nr:right-handed parallel beta-helix repeat-containing protein [Planctomycetota bacterium]
MGRSVKVIGAASLGAGLIAAGLIGAGLTGARLVVAGPLNPPAGSVASSYKTLNEVEPRIAINATNTPGDADSLFKITQSGSYYLTGNVIGVADKHGIEIAASGVTLDLNGFEVVGLLGGGSLDGIRVSVDGLSNIAVRNGTIRNWGDWGLDFGNILAGGCLIEHVRASGCMSGGLAIGPGSRVSHCTANGNGEYGISVSFGTTMTHCSAASNTGIGLNTDVGCTVVQCTSTGNVGAGISTACCSTVTQCTAYGNSGYGIIVGSRSNVIGSTASSNTSGGIYVSSGSTVLDSVASLNGSHGVSVGDSGCTVRGNTCSQNGNNGADQSAAGIWVFGTGSRIEGNNTAKNGRGIHVVNTSNIIVRNTSSANTAANWSVVAGNVCVVVQATAGGLINGNAGGTSPGSADPSANYTY